MKLCCIWVIGILSAPACYNPAYGQQSSDSLFDESVSSFRRIYFEKINGNALIYHGSKYAVEKKYADGIPFFQTNAILAGTITYQGTLYTPLEFHYDLTMDAVVTDSYLHDDLITLASDKIDSFSIGSHVFIHFTNISNGLPKKGFYEQLYSGDPGLYVRREKKFYYGVGHQESRYVESNYYFIRDKDFFYNINSKADMLNLFNDQGDAMKKYIKTNKLNFKKDTESALLHSVIFYSRLKH
jgi:hypothetical protein